MKFLPIPNTSTFILLFIKKLPVYSFPHVVYKFKNGFILLNEINPAERGKTPVTIQHFTISSCLTGISGAIRYPSSPPI